MPVGVIITKGAGADCKEAVHLISGIEAENLLADRGYDAAEIISYAAAAEMTVVIPPKKNRKVQRDYDRYLYRIRHLAENAFLWLKPACRQTGAGGAIAARYAKNTASFLAAVQSRCIEIWLNILT